MEITQVDGQFRANSPDAMFNIWRNLVPMFPTSVPPSVPATRQLWHVAPANRAAPSRLFLSLIRPACCRPAGGRNGKADFLDTTGEPQQKTSGEATGEMPDKRA